MLAAVSFDDDPMLRATEVSEETPDCVLSAEFCSEHLTAAEMCPQLAFGLCFVSAKTTCELGSFTSAIRVPSP